MSERSIRVLPDESAQPTLTFNLLNILFQLQASTASGKSLLLTLPVGH